METCHLSNDITVNPPLFSLVNTFKPVPIQSTQISISICVPGLGTRGVELVPRDQEDRDEEEEEDEDRDEREEEEDEDFGIQHAEKEAEDTTR